MSEQGEALRRLDWRELTRETVRGVGENDLLTFASAIAFQAMTAIVPLALFGLALLGYLHLDAVWRDHLAPDLRTTLGPEAFGLADHVVVVALGAERGFWLSAGALITVWEVSGGVRAIMSALSRVYADDETRPKRRRFAISFALAVTVIAFVLVALLVFSFGGAVAGPVGSVGKWPVSFGLLVTLVWIVLRFAPVRSQATRWVSFGSGLCVLAWLVTSAGFGIWIGYVADYGTIFSSLASVFILMTYLYLSAIAFLVGAQIDELLRESAKGASAAPRRSPREDATPRPATSA